MTPTHGEYVLPRKTNAKNALPHHSGSLSASQGLSAFTSENWPKSPKAIARLFCHAYFLALAAARLVFHSVKSSWNLSSNMTPRHATVTRLKSLWGRDDTTAELFSRPAHVWRRDSSSSGWMVPRPGEHWRRQASLEALRSPRPAWLLYSPNQSTLPASSCRSCCAQSLMCFSSQEIPIRGPGEIGSSIGKTLCWQQREPRGRIRAPPRASISWGEKVWGGGEVSTAGSFDTEEEFGSCGC